MEIEDCYVCYKRTRILKSGYQSLSTQHFGRCLQCGSKTRLMLIIDESGKEIRRTIVPLYYLEKYIEKHTVIPLSDSQY